VSYIHIYYFIQTSTILNHHSNWDTCPCYTTHIRFPQRIIQSSVLTSSDTSWHSPCHQVRSIYLSSAFSVVQGGGSPMMQDPGCVVDGQDIPSKTATRVAQAVQRLALSWWFTSCEQAKLFHLDDFLQVLQWSAVAVCIQCCPVVKDLMQKNALCILKCWDHLSHRPLSQAWLSISIIMPTLRQNTEWQSNFI
jgi:hypothetical protein